DLKVAVQSGTNLHEAALLDCHVGLGRRRAGPVEHMPAAEYDPLAHRGTPCLETEPACRKAKPEAGRPQATVVGRCRPSVEFPRAQQGSPAAVSPPTGFDEAGLPIGMQLVAKPAGEATPLQVAAQLEGAIGLSDRRPSLGPARGTPA